jgi:hypothetical protein
MEKFGKTRQATSDAWRIRFACWKINATDKHSEYIIFMVFAREQWLNERASMLRLYVR